LFPDEASTRFIDMDQYTPAPPCHDAPVHSDRGISIHGNARCGGSMSVWSTDIIQRYGGPGPRYTSYPPAHCFHEEFTHQDYGDALAAGNAERRPLALYMHLPFCEHVCYYCACNRIVTGDKRLAAPYLDTVLAEMAQKSERVD